MALGDKWVPPRNKEVNRMKDFMGITDGPKEKSANRQKFEQEFDKATYEKSSAFNNISEKEFNKMHEVPGAAPTSRVQQARNRKGTIDTFKAMDGENTKYDPDSVIKSRADRAANSAIGANSPLKKSKNERILGDGHHDRKYSRRKINPNDGSFRHVNPSLDSGDKSNNTLKANGVIDYMKKDFEAFSKAGSQTIDKIGGSKDLKDIYMTGIGAGGTAKEAAETAFETAKTERTMGKIGGELLDDLGRGNKMAGGAKLGAYMAGGIAIADFLNPFSLGWND